MANLIPEELYHLLVEKQALIQDPIVVPHNYSSLKTQTIQQELRDEIEALIKLFGEGLETFRQGFLDRCKHRAEQNAGTCLSLFAMPDGECNQLYWQIAECLFEPKTMGDMLRLLLPDNTMLISYEVTEENRQQSLRERVKNPVFHFEAKNLACLTQEPSRTALSQFAVSGGQLFDVTDLVQWEFTTHTKFFNSFSQQYPELAEALYQHNEAFKKLRQHLLAVSKGQSPREVIKEFIQQLLLGGETLTGEAYASLEAQTAVTDFFGYLESLPDSLKEGLLELETPSDISLDYVCEHLKAENCVEQAAAYLQEILNNKENAATLDTRPDLSPEQLQGIHKSYGKSHALSSVSDSPTALPLNYLKKNLEALVIDDMHVLLDLLLAFPPGYYPMLFKYAQISCDATSLGDMMASGIFLGEQLTALNQAFIDNMEKCGGFSVCLQFALHYNNDELVKHLFSLLAQKEQPAIFLIEQLGGFSESVRIAIAHKNYDLLKLILTSLPLEERLAALVEAKLADGTPMLAFATVRMPSQFHWILELLPEEHRLTAITLTAGNPTVLYLTADPETIATTLSLLPEKDRLTALRAETRGKSGLWRGAFRIEVFKVILALLPPADRLNAVTERIFSDQNALEITLSREAFKEILNLLPDIVPPPANPTHSTKQNKQIVTLYNRIRDLRNYGLELYSQVYSRDAETAGKQIICIAISLAMFANHFINAQTNVEQQTAQRNFLGELQQNIRMHEQTFLQRLLINIVISAFAYALCLSKELGALVEDGLFNSEQLAHLNETIVTNIEQAGGISTGLRFALTYKNHELLRLILLSLAPEERLAVINEKSSEGKSVLHFAAHDLEALKAILMLLPESDRLAAVNQKDNNGDSVLHLNPGPLKTILMLLPESDRQAAINEKNNNFGYSVIHLAANNAESLTAILTSIPESARLTLVNEKANNGRTALHSAANKPETLEAILNLLPEMMPQANPNYSAKRNEQISMLYSNINQLRSYGRKLYNQVNDKKAETEGEKAVCLALTLNYFANKFMNTQNNEERQIAQEAFQKELKQGILDMHHRARWKPVLANIIIAATGIGLLVIFGKLYLTKSAFFMQTERHKQIDKIASHFTALLTEEAPSTNSTADEIVSLLKTSLSGPSA
ncbi:ankyrin repeat domain-containing protein [Legionella feeleii]|uniref:Ankyrin repeat protein n=1 Tax=Legionella feeleii TaxID=453 RepID=A0A0W0TKX3_9GAMM|nr:ankyrin repeat domain-containing protein [Legionella feeleii]KTC96218.1 Ankyrin repeat protein [Legionella feeleii]SPX60997.1 Ankyrin repeat protein [Legionella feeleii]